MSDYWLIYIHTDILDSPRAKKFYDAEEIQPWIDEQENIEILDCVPCSEESEEE